ncbi:hypothetical protein E4T56_gene17761 [Termitomyces sp. T112]|nr:hypothetical protein E4T56_gene17761 [Termitomyces sp. T112]
MKNHPGLLKLSLFALECGMHKFPWPADPDLRLVPLAYEYERITYYSGITSNGDHPELVYRSDFRTTPFPEPTGRFSFIPVKSLRGVFDTPLNDIWLTVGPQICNLIQAHKVQWTSIDPARFFTHTAKGEEALEDKVKGTLGPVVIWVGIRPGSTSRETAHEVSQEILALLRKNGVEGVIVEWREAEPQMLAGPPLMCHVSEGDPTHYVRYFLTASLGVPLAMGEMEGEDTQGTLTMWFHENKDKHGNPSNRVFGVSNCHVLRNDTATKYEHRGGMKENYVRVCGMRRFQHGLDDIRKAIDDHAMLAEYYTRGIATQQAKVGQDPEAPKQIRRLQRSLEAENEAVVDLEALYGMVTTDWSDIKLQRNIGHMHYARPIEVGVKGPHGEIGPAYTSHWAVFVAAEAKVKPHFEGNVVDLGSKYTPMALAELLYPMSDVASTFQFPDERKLRIQGCATEADLAIHPRLVSTANVT